MKIAIPVDDKNPESGVCVSFGRAPYYLFYDTDTKEYHYLDNGAASGQGGAGIKAAQSIADNGAEALLTVRCGENAEQVLSGAGVTIYKTIQATARENIKAFTDKKLFLLNNIHPGFHSHGR
ncbi:MAG: NifB/NifX family molybdenum-iron cluster-binding protein [Eubacteriales bacterium]|nr:NifB/NifX family molybdenum-iron cluster-binding protein [Eubacteriales bacterium]